MIKTAEYVSLGHPDKIADYISSAVLDECISQDPAVRYAVEVMVKNNHIILGGEVSGNIRLNNLTDIVKQALRDIGYDEKYNQIPVPITTGIKLGKRGRSYSKKSDHRA